MTILRFVRHHLVLDYAKCGWSIADTFDDVCHGTYGILMAWLCGCPCVEPRG